MIANGREKAVVSRALIGLTALAALVLGLGYSFGLLGAAVGVLAAASVTLVLDAHYVSRTIGGFDAPRFLWKPLASGALAGVVLVCLDGAALTLRLGAGLAAFLATALLVRLLPRAERAFLHQAMRHGIGK